jgi:hypothetical protein
MSTATDEELTAMVKAWEDREKEIGLVAENIALIHVDLPKEMEEIKNDLVNGIGEMDLSDEAAEAGRNTIQGFIDAASDPELLALVTSAYANVGDAAIDAINSQKGIDANSPSKKSHWSGEMVGEGLIGGVSDMLPEMQAVMSGAADEGIKAFNSEEAQIVAFTPAFMSALSAMGSANKALYAEPVSKGSYSIVIQYSPQISGVENPEQLEATLATDSERLRDMILEIIEEADVDAGRRAYK